jgi:hemolysin activation/secretion protein
MNIWILGVFTNEGLVLRFFQRIAAAFSLSLLLLSAWSQPIPPGAGSLLNQIEQNRQGFMPKSFEPPASDTVKPERPKDDPSGMRIVLKGIRFEGNTLLTDQQLLVVVKKHIGQSLNFSQLQDMAQEVAQVYRESGWVVRAYLPKQDLTEGILLISVIEARFGGVQFSGQEHASVSLQRLTDRVTAAQPLGAPIHYEDLERATLLLEDLPGMSVTTGLTPGPQENQSSLLVSIASKPRWDGDVGLENMGSHATGKYRQVASLNLLSPAQLGDQAGFNVAHTAGSDYLRAAYSLPVGNEGWRLGVNASGMNYKLVAPEFVSMLGHGQSLTYGLEATYPFLRSRTHNLNFTSNLDHKSFTNWASGNVTSQYSTQALTLGISGYALDSWVTPGMSSGSLSFVSGKVNLDGSPNQSADLSTTQTQGSFSKLKYALSRQQGLTAQTMLTVSLSGQRASKNLDSSEKFFLGGASGVRAFPSGEGGGAEGDMLNVEWKWMLRPDLSFSSFADWGHVRINKFNDYQGAPTVNQFDIKGAGLSMTLTPRPGWTAKVVWSHRIGSNPNATSAGLDQDGTLIKNRFWFQATMML